MHRHVGRSIEVDCDIETWSMLQLSLTKNHVSIGKASFEEVYLLGQTSSSDEDTLKIPDSFFERIYQALLSEQVRVMNRFPHALSGTAYSVSLPPTQQHA